MHSGTLAAAVGTVLMIGILAGAALADEAAPTPPLENGFLIGGEPVDAQALEDIFTRDVRSQAVEVRYEDGGSTVYEIEPAAPAAVGEGQTTVTPEVEVAPVAAVEQIGPAAGTDEAPAAVGEGQATVTPEAEVAPVAAVEQISPAAGTDEAPGAAAQPVLGMLSEDDIRARVIGNTATRFLRGGWWTEYYAPDGAIRGRWRNVPFTGTWSVRNEAMCFDYAGTRSDYCARLTLDKSTVFLYTPDGIRHGRTLNLLPGNPSKL